MVQVVRVLAEEQRQDIGFGDVADVVHELFEILEMQDLALLELHNRLDLFVDVLLPEGTGRIGSKQILLEPLNTAISEVLSNSIPFEKELKLQEEPNELIIPFQLLPFGLTGLMQYILLHHILIILLEDVLDLLEVLPPAVGEVLPRDLAAPLHELLLQVDAFLQRFVLSLVVGAVESGRGLGGGSHPAVPAGLC